MPTISIFFGIVIQMYWRDHNPPHLHAFYQGNEALFSIESGEVLAGSLPATARRIVGDWIMRERDRLMMNWERGRLNEPFERVPGADAS
jgi:hypothetical protein